MLLDKTAHTGKETKKGGEVATKGKDGARTRQLCLRNHGVGREGQGKKQLG